MFMPLDNIRVPVASTTFTWYSGILSIPLLAGKFTLTGVAPVQIAKRTGVLYRIVHASMSFNCSADAFNSGMVPTNPAAVQLCITAKNGEFVLADKLLLGVDHPFPLNAWRRTKNSEEPLFIVPYGEVDGLVPDLIGVSPLNICCRFQVESISDKDFLAQFTGGCL
jgi:hypothetical protein